MVLTSPSIVLLENVTVDVAKSDTSADTTVIVLDAVFIVLLVNVSVVALPTNVSLESCNV